MFARLVLIATIIGFVYARNIVCCVLETPTKLDKAPTIEIMERTSVPWNAWNVSATENQQPVQKDILPRTIAGSTTSHAHVVVTHPKKRAVSDKRKEDPQQVDPRPGCCG